LSGRLTVTPYQPLSAVVYRKLREAIFQGVFRPGQRLVQADLARQMGVSRIPVREALHRLSEEGLVDLTPHKGAVVRRPDPGELEESWAAARVLVRVAMEHAVTRITDAQIAELERVNAALIRRVARGRSAEAAVLNRRFHRGIFEAAGLGKLYDCMDALLACYPQGTQASLAVRGPAAAAEHEEILAGLRSRDLVRLLAAADKHTVNNGRTILRLAAAPNAADDCAAL